MKVWQRAVVDGGVDGVCKRAVVDGGEDEVCTEVWTEVCTEALVSRGEAGQLARGASERGVHLRGCQSIQVIHEERSNCIDAVRALACGGLVLLRRGSQAREGLRIALSSTAIERTWAKSYGLPLDKRTTVRFAQRESRLPYARVAARKSSGGSHCLGHPLL
jgi:hypothetical protein